MSDESGEARLGSFGAGVSEDSGADSPRRFSGHEAGRERREGWGGRAQRLAGGGCGAIRGARSGTPGGFVSYCGGPGARRVAPLLAGFVRVCGVGLPLLGVLEVAGDEGAPRGRLGPFGAWDAGEIAGCHRAARRALGSSWAGPGDDRCSGFTSKSSVAFAPEPSVPWRPTVAADGGASPRINPTPASCPGFLWRGGRIGYRGGVSDRCRRKETGRVTFPTNRGRPGEVV